MQLVDGILAGIGLAFVFGMSGAFIAFGFAVVCKWLQWAPVNITLNITRTGNEE